MVGKIHLLVKKGCLRETNLWNIPIRRQQKVKDFVSGLVTRINPLFGFFSFCKKGGCQPGGYHFFITHYSLAFPVCRRNAKNWVWIFWNFARCHSKRVVVPGKLPSQKENHSSNCFFAMFVKFTLVYFVFRIVAESLVWSIPQKKLFFFYKMFLQKRNSRVKMQFLTTTNFHNITESVMKAVVLQKSTCFYEILFPFGKKSAGSTLMSVFLFIWLWNETQWPATSHNRHFFVL